MYWTDAHTTSIKRANLDGSDVEVLIILGSSFPLGIAVDPFEGKMYWSEGDKIRRANLDGSNIEDVVTTGLVKAWGIALDLLALPGDCNLDGTLNLDDHLSLVGCTAGPGTNSPPGCNCADANYDGSVDLKDFAAFQVGFDSP